MGIVDFHHKRKEGIGACYADGSLEEDKKRLRKSIKTKQSEISNIINVIAKTGSESLAAALDSK